MTSQSKITSDYGHPPLVSVIVPCYRQAAFLGDALQSVVDQTYTDWECVVVNDGSPDDTSNVVNAFMREHPSRQIRLIEKENEGLAEARNSGIRVANGEWIACLDSDDKFDPAYLQAAIQKAGMRPGVNHVAPDIRYFGAKTGTNPVHPFRPELILDGNMFPYASMYRRELWCKAGGYLPIIPFGAEDWNFWVTVSESLVHERLSEPLFCYRKHEGPSMVDNVEAHQAEVNACLKTIHPDLYRPEFLLQAHETLLKMSPVVETQIEKTIAKFPHFSQPYLWRALARQSKGRRAEARRDLMAAAKLGSLSDWQPYFWLALVCAEEKDNLRAAEAAKETLSRCPSVPFAEQMKVLVSQGGRP